MTYIKQFEQSQTIGIIVIDAEGYILSMNSFSKYILSLYNESKEYMKIDEIIPEIGDQGAFKTEIKLFDQEKERIFAVAQHPIDITTENSIIILQEISELKQLRRENHLLKTVLDDINVGIQITDENNKITFYNKACETIEGINREEYLGKIMTEMYQFTDKTKQKGYHGIVKKTGKPVKDIYNQYESIEGKKFDVITSVVPYKEERRTVAVYSILRDITMMKKFMNENIELRKRLLSDEINGKNGTQYNFNKIIGNNETLKTTILSAKKIAKNNSNVLILGETGTGKELFSQSIHNESKFFEGPFVAINCAAIPDTLLESVLFGTVKGAFTGAIDSPGVFEQAENGTLFLDEINSMGINLQAKLLRVLQEKAVRRIGDKAQRKVRCRIISSINEEPMEAIKNKKLREDIYYRLGAVTLYILPLRERRDDIPMLIDFFIKKYNHEFGNHVEGISNELMSIFMEYKWPGNVRELEHAVESAMNLVNSDDKIIDKHHLPIYLQKKFLIPTMKTKRVVSHSKNLADILDEVEMQVIIERLHRNEGNISKTAKELGIFRQALQYRIKKYSLNDLI